MVVVMMAMPMVPMMAVAIVWGVVGMMGMVWLIVGFAIGGLMHRLARMHVTTFGHRVLHAIDLVRQNSFPLAQERPCLACLLLLHGTRFFRPSSLESGDHETSAAILKNVYCQHIGVDGYSLDRSDAQCHRDEFKIALGDSLRIIVEQVVSGDSQSKILARSLRANLSDLKLRHVEAKAGRI
jgi:hypothetical protein